uniref:Uncharacterized protein n=1 Tax=Triticum urartu TaxID=4572 RepID=A0A8R7Q2X9_TRIUA
MLRTVQFVCFLCSCTIIYGMCLILYDQFILSKFFNVFFGIYCQIASTLVSVVFTVTVLNLPKPNHGVIYTLFYQSIK